MSPGCCSPKLTLSCSSSSPPPAAAPSGCRLCPCSRSTVSLSGISYRAYPDPHDYVMLQQRQGDPSTWSPPIAAHRLVCWWAWGPSPSPNWRPATSCATSRAASIPGTSGENARVARPPRQAHGASDPRLLMPPPRCRWGTHAENKREDWRLKKQKKRNLFKSKDMCPPCWCPTMWMLEHDGFPIQPRACASSTPPGAAAAQL